VLFVNAGLGRFVPFEAVTEQGYDEMLNLNAKGRVMSVYNLAFRAGIPLGALSLGKLIPIGVPTAIAGFGLSLVGVASYFLIVMSKAPTFRRPAKSGVPFSTTL